MGRPVVKVFKTGKKWGVKVKWPRSGPWARTMLFPRFAWHGPYGCKQWRWDNNEGAVAFAEIVKSLVRDILKEQEVRPA